MVEACLDRFASRGLQSDQRFVEAYVEGRQRRGYGPHRIRRELAERGVEEDLVGGCLDPDADHWYALMVQVHDKRFGSGLPQDSHERVRRARFLQYRGFDVALVRRFLWSQA